MKNKIFLGALTMFSAMQMGAEEVEVRDYSLAGPYTIQKPFAIDSINAEQVKLSDDKTMYGDVSIARFAFSTGVYNKAQVKVKGAKQSKVFIDGKEVGDKRDYQPGQYSVEVRFLTDSTVTFGIECDKAVRVLAPKSGDKRPFTLQDNMLLSFYRGVSVSPSGRYAFITSGHYNTNGGIEDQTRLIDAQTGKVLRKMRGGERWMPREDRYLHTRTVRGKQQLLSIDPLTMDERILCKDMPYWGYVMAPTQDYLVLTESENGPKKEDGVYQVLTMSDRQPGWRNRSQLHKLDLQTGMIQPLTYGKKSTWLIDISSDGMDIFIGVSEERLEKRPTSLTSVLRMNSKTLKVDTIISRDGFIGSIGVIPGKKALLVDGSAEAFDGIGKILPDTLISNYYERQLFLVDTETKAVMPLTKDFDPALKSFVVNGKDGYAYFTAETADSVSLYRINLASRKIEPIKQPIEVITGISLSDNGTMLMVQGSGACTPNRTYAINTKTLKAVLVDDINSEELAEVKIGTCRAWRFKSERGYELTGHAYLPADFDETAKYPMLVHYYGGCSPTSRRFGNGAHYPAHYWNALGYVVLIVNPSGAAGFGQEWAARHVNTAGEGPAQDVIEATKWFCNNNSFIDSKKLGCLSASYGGFLTQWILTKTDMFAAGVSHAGISDHSSYWGNGYWGYSYSEISMADSYPWTRKDLYVDCSPLFNAEKIKTPLLFTHGTADTNVPPMESVQMFTALKLLGTPTALVMVEGENHGIMEYFKRQKWINSIVAWFEKYLKGDSTWWDAIYKDKKL